MIEDARRLATVLEATPYAARLGLRCGEIMGDAVTASVPYAASLANAQGFVHGGVAASLSVWSAMLVAVASDREAASSVRPVSISLSFLVAAREEALYATARLAWRGREIVHVEVEVASERGRPAAAALVVLRTGPEPPRVQPAGAAQPPPLSRDDLAPRIVSPFSRSMGAEVRAHDGTSATLVMRHGPNEGLAGAIDPGALIALADTCAAVACVPSLDERVLGSATLSLSATFGDPVEAGAVAIGRPIAEDGSVRTALVEVHEDAGGPARSSRYAAMTASVTYRFLGADAGLRP